MTFWRFWANNGESVPTMATRRQQWRLDAKECDVLRKSAYKGSKIDILASLCQNWLRVQINAKMFEYFEDLGNFL